MKISYPAKSATSNPSLEKAVVPPGQYSALLVDYDLDVVVVRSYDNKCVIWLYCIVGKRVAVDIVHRNGEFGSSIKVMIPSRRYLLILTEPLVLKGSDMFLPRNSCLICVSISYCEARRLTAMLEFLLSSQKDWIRSVGNSNEDNASDRTRVL